MKIAKFILFLLASSFAFASCLKVDEPDSVEITLPDMTLDSGVHEIEHQMDPLMSHVGAVQIFVLDDGTYEQADGEVYHWQRKYEQPLYKSKSWVDASVSYSKDKLCLHIHIDSNPSEKQRKCKIRLISMKGLSSKDSFIIQMPGTTLTDE